MKIILNDKEYTFLKGYQKNDQLRAAFNALAIQVFNLSFEEWYQSGYWQEKYIPYTLFDGEQAVSNISINIMDFQVLGQTQRYIQLGTVMTDENYRGKNLNRFLMEKILEEWNSNCDLIYLFANSTVLQFYPKFGFKSVKEYQHSKSVAGKGQNHHLEKMDMDLQTNRDKLYDYVKNTTFVGKLSMQENADLVLFYGITVFKENIYYLKLLDAIVVANFQDNQLHLLDIFSKVKVEVEQVIDALLNSEINKVVLGFTPENTQGYECQEIEGDDMLFIQNGKTEIFEENALRFPVLSHA